MGAEEDYKAVGASILKLNELVYIKCWLLKSNQLFIFTEKGSKFELEILNITF